MIRHWMMTAGVLVLTTSTALALVFTTHLCRSHYAELQRLDSHRWFLQEEYSRLMLERSTLASPHRVTSIAREDLLMTVPELHPITVVAAGEAL